MKFNEKMTKLLSITEVSSVQLSKKLLLDPSQISRMKTGTRGKPNNTNLIWNMAVFFASRCNTDYKISALSELTGNSRMLVSYAENALAEAIFEWLCSQDDDANQHIDNFLHIVSSFSNKKSQFGNNISYGDDNINKSQFLKYTGNSGKRQAVLEMLNILLRDNKPTNIYLYTDENNKWFTEIPNYSSDLAKKISALAQMGYTFFRVNTTHDSLEKTLKGIEQWLSAYICGAVKEYCYPFLRDDLHRRTLFVVPDKLALYSHSLANQTESRITSLCLEKDTVKEYYDEVQDIFALCRPMARVYTMEETDLLLSCLRRMASMETDGIYKTASLSIPTMPLCITERIGKENNSPILNKIIKNQHERAELRNELLTRYKIEDIMTLANVEDVKQGKVPLPSTKMLHDDVMYYTPLEYRLHLQAIVDSMERFPNYRVILTENPTWKDVILYAKANGTVLLIKDKNPFALFEITETKMSVGMYDFLKHISRYESTKAGRDETLTKLKKTIQELS